LTAEADFDTDRTVVRPWRTDNERPLAVCRRMGITALGRTTRYYSTELELFRSRAR
jgi:hypothetical protein